MKKKVLSMALILSILASMLAVGQMSAGAAAIPVPEGITLFADDFEGYPNGIVSDFQDGKHRPAAGTVNEQEGFVAYGYHSVLTDNVTYYTPTADRTKLMQLADSTEANFGSGKVLKVTAQSGLQEQQLIRTSGVTADRINGKALVFSTKFTVPKFVGFADGAGVYLAAPNENNQYVSISSEHDIYMNYDLNDKKRELLYLGARASKQRTSYADIWNAKWDISDNNNTVTRYNDLWTFGELVAKDLTPGKEYTYTITMKPNGDHYTVTVDLDGTKKELGTEAAQTESCTNIPTPAEMALFSAVQVMRLTNPYDFIRGHMNPGQEDTFPTWLEKQKNIGITTTLENGKLCYNNDRVVAYFDDMSFQAFDPAELVGVVFEENFESYEPVHAPGGLDEMYDVYGWWWYNKTASNFDKDTFRWMCGATIDYSENSAYEWIKAAPNPGQVARIAAGTGVGGGKALKITGQPGITNYSMAKMSHLDTAEIDGKQLEFRVDFQAPISGVRGEGFGVWVAQDVTSETESPAVQYISGNKGLIDGTGEIVKGELMYVGSRKDLKNTTLTSAGSRATYLYVFGQEVARLNPDAKYDLLVTLIPIETGGYTGAVTLNGRVIALDSKKLPSQTELKSYKRLYVNPISDVSVMHNTGGELWSAVARPADMIDPEKGYQMGRIIGILDNLSLIARTASTLPEVSPVVNMPEVQYDWTSKGTSFINAAAVVSGSTAAITAYSDKTEASTIAAIAATFSEDDRLIKAVMSTETEVAAGGTVVVTLTGLPEEYSRLKLFLWNGYKSLTPVTAAFTK